jgi:type III secretion protein K
MTDAQPLHASLLQFNLLPSRTLHAARAQALWPGDAQQGAWLARADVQRALERSRSSALLEQLGASVQPVQDMAQPALPLALAAPALLQALTREAGVLLLNAHLRHTIVRAQVQAASTALGQSALDWARQAAQALHPGLNATQLEPWLQGDLATCADTLGEGVVAQAWQDAPAPLRLRADWKLSPTADRPEVRAASGLPPERARAVCLSLLARLDPPWLSNFPAIH